LTPTQDGAIMAPSNKRRVQMKYGVSFNCYVDNEEIGEGEEPTLNYVGDDLDKIEQFIVTDAKRQNYNQGGRWKCVRDHEMVGYLTNLSDGEIVSVIVEYDEDMDDDEDGYVLCVIFNDPPSPRVIG